MQACTLAPKLARPSCSTPGSGGGGGPSAWRRKGIGWATENWAARGAGRQYGWADATHHSVGRLGRHARRVGDASDALDLARVEVLNGLELLDDGALEVDLPAAERGRAALLDLELQPLVDPELIEQREPDRA